MRTALSAFTLALVLVAGAASGPAHGAGYMNTEVIETEIVSVDPKTNLIEYHLGDARRTHTLFVPAHVLSDLSGIVPGSFAMIEFELDSGRRQLISIRVEGMN